MAAFKTNPTIHLASLNSNITTNNKGNKYIKSNNSNISQQIYNDYIQVFYYKYTKYQWIMQILDTLF